MKSTYLVTVSHCGNVSPHQMEDFIKDSVQYGDKGLASDDPLFGYKPCDVQHLPSGTKISIKIKDFNV